MSTLVSRQLIKARAAVLLATLIVVPLVAALGTSPREWFAQHPAEPEIANVEQQEAQQQTAIKRPETRKGGEDVKLLEFIQPSQLNETEDAETANRSDDAVLRRWTQDDPIPAPPSRDLISNRPVGGTSQSPSQFRQIEQQLRDWGATYYLLEHWSSEGPLYRFHCRMSINELKHYNQHFEAVASDPVDAMHDVLEQVRQWRDAIAQPPTT